MEDNTVTEGKTIAIISYITFIGLIIAFVMNNEKKNSFASFHIRQSLGLVALYIALWIVMIVINMIVSLPFLSTILYLGLLVFWVLGLIAAIQGQQKAIPVFGEQFQKWFKNIG